MNFKKAALIIDLDGTLCNSEHRQHFLETEGKPKDWDAFFREIKNDKINNWCWAIIDNFKATHEIIFLTGRNASEPIHEDTINWLDKHDMVGKQFHLMMRPADDNREDFEVKKDIYKEKIEPKYQVLFCIDDRDQVVKMWRELGLTCLDLC